MKTSNPWKRCASVFMVLFALLSVHGMLVAQDVNWTSCGTYPVTLNVFTVNVLAGVPVVTTDYGLYTYNWSNYEMTKYNEGYISAATDWNQPILTLADRPALNGRVFAYTSQRGQLLYSDDGGKHWNSTAIPTGEAAYSGIAVLDSGVILVTTVEDIPAGAFARGVAISYDNGEHWESLTKPHADTMGLPISVSSCYGSGRYGFYSTVTAGLIATFDGGKTWGRQEHGLVIHSQIIGGDDSTVLAYTQGRIDRMNFKTGNYRYFLQSDSITITSAYVDGDQILVSTSSDNKHSIYTLNSDLQVIDSIIVPTSVRSIRRVNGELWVFFQSRVGKLQGSTVTTGPTVTDAALQSKLHAAVHTPEGGIISLSQTEIARVDDCGVAAPLLSPRAVSFYSSSINERGVIFCSGPNAQSVDFTTGAVVDLHRGLQKSGGNRYSRFHSIIRTRTGRLIGSPRAILKNDTIPPAMYVSDDDGATWRAVTNGFPARILEPIGVSDQVLGSTVIETPSGVVITGLRSSRYLVEELDSGVQGAGVFYSADGGETWVPPTVGTPLYSKHIRDLAATDNVVFALASALAPGMSSPYVHLYVSENDGKQWSLAGADEKLQLTADFKLTSYRDTVFLFDVSPSGRVQYSVDGGETFTKYIEPVDGELKWFSVSSAGPILTTNKGMYVKGTSTAVVDESKDGERIQREYRPWIVVSPLPTGDRLSVSFLHLTEFLDGISSVKMYSTTGDIVADFTGQVRDAMRAGSVTISLDCKTLADGVYLVHMAAGRDSLTRKVLIKK